MAVIGDAAGPQALSPETSVIKPPGSVKFFYSFGQVVESGYLAMNGFVFFYYTAVLGLSGTMVGLALAISMCLDAVADPLIGSWSDSVRSRFGRRMPVMLAGAPLTFLTMGLLFAPPTGLAPFMLFLWLTVSKMAVRAFASVYNIPYFALGGEMSDDYVERGRIVAYRLLGGIVATVLITALAFSVFFVGEGGLQRREAYPSFGWAVGAFMLIVALICCAGIWRYVATLPQPASRPEPMLPRLPGELAEVFRNASFRILFFSLVVFTSAAGVAQALNNHAAVFVWRLPTESIQTLTYGLMGGITLGTPTAPLLMRVLEKKVVAWLGFAVVVVPWLGLPLLWTSGLYQPTGAEALGPMLVTTLLVGFGSGLVFIALPAMMADAADEHEYLFGARREGLYFSGLGFAGKAAAGVGGMVGGVSLDLMHFPREAGAVVGAAIPADVLDKLILAWGALPATMTALGALLFIPYAIDRRRQAQIAAAIRERRAAA